MTKESLVLFPGRQEKEFPGDLLRSLTTSVLVLDLLFVLTSFLFFPDLFQRALFFGGGVLLTCILVFLLIYMDKLKLAGVLLVSSLWLMVSYGAYTAGGVDSPIFVGYAAVIMLGALVLGMKTGVAVI
ncbi:MAG TPA: hypothetical protein PLN43_15500, partial [Anaerolineales bacterium]|nr:hypothetical protein [Anaerolineales bacterium]